MRWPWTRDWVLIDKTVMPSPLELMIKRGSLEVKRTCPALLRSTVVLSYKCKLTGRIKTVTVRSDGDS